MDDRRTNLAPERRPIELTGLALLMLVLLALVPLVIVLSS